MITQNCINDINKAAVIEDVIGEYIPLKRSGKSLVGTCPSCNSKDKFSVDKQKEIWKCWTGCASGKGPTSFLMWMKKDTYPEALKRLADKYNVVIEYEDNNNQVLPQQKAPALPAKEKAKQTESFRDIQLKDSGLNDNDQKYKKKLEKTDGTDDHIEMDRYQKGSINPDWSIDLTGDDMIMHYMDLYGKPKTYHNKGKSKELPLIRVRYANPALHTDKDGRPMKYQSPFNSGSQLWINQSIRNKFESQARIETLFIQEGEKKADKATKHGLPSVGVMGIHNVAANKQLPREFELIIKRCDVQNVVFVVDGDFLDISSNPTASIDYRPKGFMRAILNFHDYFYALNNSGINLNIYFAYIKPETQQKGIDDLLTNTLKGKEADLLSDVKKTMIEPNGVGLYMNCHKITNTNEFKLRKEFFHMENNAVFAKFHADKLKDRKLFKIGKEFFKFSTKEEFPELEVNTLVLAQPISADEEFWEERFDKRSGGMVCSFKYVKCIKFLENRRFGLLNLGEGNFDYIKCDDNVVRVVKPTEIKFFLSDFVKNALQKESVLEMLYKGGKMYLSENLTNLEFIPLKIHRAEKNLQYIYFNNCYWKITASGVEEKSLNELDGHVWQDSIIPFAAKKLQPMIKLVKEGKGFKIEYPAGLEAATKCDFYNYLFNTSNFYWEETGEGYAKLHPTAKPKRAPTQLEVDDLNMHLMSKFSAIGYLLHTYYDANVRKMVFGMDGKLSEVGSSNGRSGKSLVGQVIKLSGLLPTVEINGKKKDLTEDRFAFGKVTPRTKLVFIDDVRVNFDVEMLFPRITGQWECEDKGSVSITIPLEDSPKMYGTTNHALNGEGGSFTDRLFFIAFSDFYNAKHRPVDEHKVMFHYEWSTEQYNLFYNLMACCLQVYLEHGLISAPMERLEQRRLRQQMGENFVEWAESFFSPDFTSLEDGLTNINRAVERETVTDSFYKMFPDSVKWMNKREVKKRLKHFCEYKKYTFNPGKEDAKGNAFGGDDKRNGKEYFTIANDKYKAEQPF
jgi:DNA primase